MIVIVAVGITACVMAIALWRVLWAVEWRVRQSAYEMEDEYAETL